MDPSAYRVPTRLVKAEIEIEGGRREDVELFLVYGAETHEGSETVGEALNRPRSFLPVRSQASEELLLVRRSAIVTVRAGAEEIPSELEQVEGVTSFIDFVRLELHGGEVLEGAVATNLPPESARISDYFNLQSELFVPLLEGDNVIFVNKDFIHIVYL
jgi:hypothetical protein